MYAPRGQSKESTEMADFDWLKRVNKQTIILVH